MKSGHIAQLSYIIREQISMLTSHNKIINEFKNQLYKYAASFPLVNDLTQSHF